MFVRELARSVSALKGAGRAAAARLARIGILSVADLLLHVPRDYDDRTETISFRDSIARGRANTAGTVTAHEWFGFGRMKTLKILVDDGSAEAALVCFNRPFLETKLPPGTRVRVVGRFERKFGELQSTSFEVDPEEAGGFEPVILPVYPLTEGIAQAGLRRLVRRAVDEYGSMVEDELPQAQAARLGLMKKADAIEAIHFPETRARAELARRTLAFEELFYLQLAVRRRAAARAAAAAPRPPRQAGSERRLGERLRERLPFALTADQEKVLAEIRVDMGSPRPMARLLQGDVGSGKTLVAFFAVLDAVAAGGQAALLAPTELLARQHADNAARLLEPVGIRLAFLSGNVDDAARKPLLAALESGDIDFVIGTHALFSNGVEFRELSLAVVDEQHRFGVLQRMAMSRKGRSPDLLLMSATPIPRTLALTVYGDLDVSTIRTMPEGRIPVTTHLARHGNEAKVYEFVRRELDAGGQAYFVYPLVGESESLGLRNAEAMREKLGKDIYPGKRIGLVHSRIKEAEKRETMAAFTRGELAILVATSVVEVGVDVPNASCMVIEHAERFGLAALHQLRGRVGRGTRKSYCFLVYSQKITEDARQRLMALKESNDGFLIAEEDLRIRGPGEITGVAQSGSLRLLVADPANDGELLELARSEAEAVLATDPELRSPANRTIRDVLERAPPFTESASGS
ncbi:MAG: ATP-dependent DNA helicase RecG [Spirochaetes bacterium]|nr:ATP-dependent DNA helicase RecG [Spirochaetota bacterium]